jgi:transposase
MEHRRHPRAKLTLEGRKLLVHRVRELGWPAARAAEAQGCARETAYRWLRRFDTEGEPGLADRSSRPHTNRLECRPSVSS